MSKYYNLLRLFSVCILIIFSSEIEAQNYVFNKVEKLGPEVNTSTEELMPLFSPKDNKLYFSRALYAKNKGGQYAGMDVWVAEKKANGWTMATNDLNGWNNKENNAVIGINRTGRVVYLMQTYGGRDGISFSKFINDKWTKPEAIPIKGLNERGFKGFFMNESYDILLISMNRKDSYGEEDLYVSLKQNGKWSDPENLGATINTPEFEISPFITKDGRKLFFSSAGHQGFGDADIYMSERLYDNWTVWTKPQNLGNKINTPGFDAYFSLSADSLAFYSSNYNSKFSDIYKVSVAVAKYEPIADLNALFGTVNDNSEKQYLTSNEVKNVIGMDVGMEVNFNRDSYEMDPSARERLYFVATKLKSQPQVRLELEGFGDLRANSGINEKLVRQRILEVINFLRGNGIDSNRMNVKEMHVIDLDAKKSQQVTLKLYKKASPN